MGKQRVPRTRNNGRWTEARFWSFIRSALRQAFQKWGPRHTARNLASRPVEGKRWRFEYQCAKCEDWFKGDEVQVDHIVPCGTLTDFSHLPEFVERMFCEADGFQVLCKPCHQEKTNDERNA